MQGIEGKVELQNEVRGAGGGSIRHIVVNPRFEVEDACRFCGVQGVVGCVTAWKKIFKREVGKEGESSGKSSFK